MLKISAAQMGRFTDASEERLPWIMLAHLRRHHALAVANAADPELLARIRRGLADARVLGFSTLRQFGVFLGLMCEYGDRFWTHPAVAEALSRPGPDRLSQLPARVHRRVWAELLAALDATPPPMPDTTVTARLSRAA